MHVVIAQCDPPISCLLACEEECISDVNTVFYGSDSISVSRKWPVALVLSTYKAETMVSKEGATTFFFFSHCNIS